MLVRSICLVGDVTKCVLGTTLRDWTTIFMKLRMRPSDR